LSLFAGREHFRSSLERLRTAHHDRYLIACRSRSESLKYCRRRMIDASIGPGYARISDIDGHRPPMA
jgi:hypothetical protein